MEKSRQLDNGRDGRRSGKEAPTRLAEAQRAFARLVEHPYKKVNVIELVQGQIILQRLFPRLALDERAAPAIGRAVAKRTGDSRAMLGACHKWKIRVDHIGTPPIRQPRLVVGECGRNGATAQREPRGADKPVVP